MRTIDVEDSVQSRLSSQDEKEDGNHIGNDAHGHTELKVHARQTEPQRKADHRDTEQEAAARSQRLPPQLGCHAGGIP